MSNSQDASDKPSSGEPELPSVKMLTKEELTKRDCQAVAYSKALLIEGDTLVYISYPGDSKCYDSTGFEISAAPHRVHSSRLMATGSKVFKKLLGPTEQFRILRRRKLVKSLPRGISYVLDLTPPDEGDEAVLLTAELSCSYGIRWWYTSSTRCLVARTLVEGEDEVISSQKISSYGSSSGHTTNSSNGTTTETKDETSLTHLQTSDNPVSEVSEAVKLAVQELDKAKVKVKAVGQLEVPEYCPVRHRAGISRLLHVIEGKDPRLDSAPKVWTLFALAKYFDCAHVVVDWIVPWLLADPNSQFVEILPEASCKMGFGMKNYLVTRAAFSILVSEEALSLAAREVGHRQADRDGTNQFGRIREDIDEDLRTRIEYASKTFHARISGTFDALVDERMEWMDGLLEFQRLKRFEHEVSRGNDFYENSDERLEVLNFQHQLRTFVRHRILATLKQTLNIDDAIDANNHRRAEQYLIEPSEMPNFAKTYSDLDGKERIFTRFLWKIILYIDLLDPWERMPGGVAKEEKHALHVPDITALWKSQWTFNQVALDAIKKNGSDGGAIPLGAISNDSFPSDDLQPQRSDSVADNVLVTHPVEMNTLASPKRLIELSRPSMMPQPGETTNLLHRSRFTPKVAPEIEANQEMESPSHSHPGEQNSHGGSWPLRLPFRRMMKQRNPSDESGHPNTNTTPIVTPKPSTSVTAPASQPSLNNLSPESSPFFSLDIFLREAKGHIRAIASTMLSTSECGFDIALTDTVLCLSQDEFKYLPLWAGGNDDDSGGVFEDVIPAATAGPMGPGPAFHTGFSEGAVSSKASSEWDAISGSSRTETAGFNTSIAVEDGHSEHVDRRRIITLSDGDFSSETFSADGDEDDYDGLNRIGGSMDKGKGIDRSIDNPVFSALSYSSAVASALGSIGHEDGSVDHSHEIDADVDFEFDDDDDEGDENTTTVGEIDDDEMNNDVDVDEDEDWDGGEEESFEFADMSDGVDHEEGVDVLMGGIVS